MQENEIPQTNNSNNNTDNVKPAKSPHAPRHHGQHKKQTTQPNAEKQEAQQTASATNVASQGATTDSKPKSNNRRRKGNKSPTTSIEGNEPWQRDMKKAIDANQKMHKDRLNRAIAIDQTSKGKIKITPLGGLGEIGGNICVFETENSAIVLDVGMSFPSEDMHGVDILVPDFSYLRQIKKKIIRNYYFSCPRRPYWRYFLSF